MQHTQTRREVRSDRIDAICMMKKVGTNTVEDGNAEERRNGRGGA